MVDGFWARDRGEKGLAEENCLLGEGESMTLCEGEGVDRARATLLTAVEDDEAELFSATKMLLSSFSASSATWGRGVSKR